MIIYISCCYITHPLLFFGERRLRAVVVPSTKYCRPVEMCASAEEQSERHEQDTTGVLASVAAPNRLI